MRDGYRLHADFVYGDEAAPSDGVTLYRNDWTKKIGLHSLARISNKIKEEITGGITDDRDLKQVRRTHSRGRTVYMHKICFFFFFNLTFFTRSP